MAYRTPRAGDLRHRIRIERRGTISDGMGGYTDRWNIVLSDIPAKIVARRGGEEVRAKRVSGIAPYDISLRSSEDTLAISSGDRAVNERTGESYAIKWAGSLDEGRSRFVMLDCESGGLIDG